MSNQEIQKFKTKINIVDLISRYLELKKSGSNYKGVCPFHNEKSPSFMVNEELQIYKCFGCNESGDIFSFIEKIEGVDFKGALHFLSEQYSIPLENNYSSKNQEKDNQEKRLIEINRLTMEYYSFILTQHKLGQSAFKYLTDKRKLTKNIIEEFRLGYAPNGWNNLCNFLKSKGFTEKELISASVAVGKKNGGVYDKFRGRIIFPLISGDTKCLGFMGRIISSGEPKYLNSSDTPIFKKGEFLYGLYKSKLFVKKEGAIVVEGNMDFLKPFQYGFKNLVATSGTALTNQHLEILKKYTTKIYFCFDADQAGINAILRGVELSDKYGLDLKVIKIKKPYKDLDEYFDAEGSEIQSLTDSAIDINDFYLQFLFQKHNKKTAIGKNQILIEFSDYYQRIKNEVTKSHYLKKISENLDLPENIVLASMEKAKKEAKTEVEVLEDRQERPKGTPSVSQNLGGVAVRGSKDSKEVAFWSLLLNSPLDTIKPIMLKSNLKYFKNQSSKELHQNLEQFLQDGDLLKFNISDFVNSLTSEVKVFVSDVIMVDLKVDLDDLDKVYKELESLLLFLKKESIKEEIKELNSLLKEAEKENSLEKVSTLISKINHLSKLL